MKIAEQDLREQGVSGAMGGLDSSAESLSEGSSGSSGVGFGLLIGSRGGMAAVEGVLGIGTGFGGRGRVVGVEGGFCSRGS